MSLAASLRILVSRSVVGLVVVRLSPSASLLRSIHQLRNQLQRGVILVRHYWELRKRGAYDVTFPQKRTRDAVQSHMLCSVTVVLWRPSVRRVGLDVRKRSLPCIRGFFSHSRTLSASCRLWSRLLPWPCPKSAAPFQRAAVRAERKLECPFLPPTLITCLSSHTHIFRAGLYYWAARLGAYSL